MIATNLLGIGIALSVAQIQLPPPNAGLVQATGLTIQDSRCSSSKMTATIPFSTSFHCEFNGTLNGCYAEFGVNLLETVPDPALPRARLRRFMCLTSSKSVRLPIADIESELSGIEVSVDAGVATFAELEFQTYVKYFDPAAMVATVVVHANWRDAPGTMMDLFDATVHGELVWTTNQNSHLIRGETSCTQAGETCITSDHKSWGTENSVGGAALRGFRLASSGGSGHPIDRLQVSVSETVTPYSSSTYGSCTVGAAPTTHCETKYLAVRGEPTEIAPYGGLVANRTWSARTTTSTAWGANPTQKNRCAMKGFTTTNDRGIAQPWGALAIGATSTDCGYTPFSAYSAFLLWDWRWMDSSFYPYYLMSTTIEATGLY
jgi:hypothetical protein